jgi:hypothetical protein
MSIDESVHSRKDTSPAFDNHSSGSRLARCCKCGLALTVNKRMHNVPKLDCPKRHCEIGQRSMRRASPRNLLHLAWNFLGNSVVSSGIVTPFRALTLTEQRLSKVSEEYWRTERDSNPRYPCGYTRVPGVRLQPLGHLSVITVSCTSIRLRRQLGRTAADAGTPTLKAADYSGAATCCKVQAMLKAPGSLANLRSQQP